MNFAPRDVTIWQRDATALLQTFGAGTTSPLEAVEAILDRVWRLDQVPNAYTALSGTLRDKAAAAARRWAEGRSAGPLDGLPVIVKNNLVSAGLPTAWGNAALARRPCPADERPVAALRRAGALVIGKGNTPEFALEGCTTFLQPAPSSRRDRASARPAAS
ncbi:hypothetical protein BYZ73_14655 [Rhodovulum viride]|uniref:Amidase domain-containing protein n=1 Tax=Rhodovulum viride TaxID=1231134 RepID=A0ABX9DDS3_9RHOB|nr:amidase family protein [Rhodovulum viride]RAP40480.1 hypothetical protein BYZ73_14655 [Rhodovulum viride]